MRVTLEALGMNWWWLCIPWNVLDVANRDSRNSIILTASSELTENEVIPSTLISAKSNNCSGMKVWFQKGRWRLACAASLLTVPPTPSQEFFPRDFSKQFGLPLFIKWRLSLVITYFSLTKSQLLSPPPW